MKARLLRLWEDLRSSYWAVPGAMGFLAGGLAHLVRYLDSRLDPSKGWLGALPAFGVEAASSLLATMASAAITVTGVIFSITIVVLNMASAQFGPRLLRNFMAHGGTQRVLGMFVAAFVFSIVALATIHFGDSVKLTVSTALVLGAGSFLLLVYFIHHVSVFIQASRILDDVAGQLEESLSRSFPERSGAGPAGDGACEADASPGAADAWEWSSDAPGNDDAWKPVPAGCSGYLQAIDRAGLAEAARRQDAIVVLRHRPGSFVIRSGPLAMVRSSSSGAGDPDIDAIGRALGENLVVGPERTATQDPEFAVHQLVEVAVRALSPGVNDPFTAINCLDRLAAALAVLARREIPDGRVRDADGRVRLVVPPLTWRGIVASAFDQIRQNARGHVAVMIRLVEILAALADCGGPDAFRDALRRQLAAVREGERGTIHAGKDLEDFDERMAAAARALGLDPKQAPGR